MHLPRAFHIHPLNYALGLADAAEAAGARIFEDTPALSIDVEGVRKRIATPSARVRAGHIVLACNVHLGALMPRVAGTLVPIWSYVIATAPLGRAARRGDRLSRRGDRYRSRQQSLPHRRRRPAALVRALDHLGGRPAEVAPKRLQADIAEVYPQLGEVEVEHAWSGVLGNALHRMPQIGELSPGLWLASGFGGHGLNTTAMAGNILAQAIVEGDDTWRLFAPFELVWAGGRLGRAAMQVYYWWFNARERFEARAARQREQEYRRVVGARGAARGGGGGGRGSSARRRGAAGELPEEPALAELPADPVIAREAVRADEPAKVPTDDGRRLPRARLPDVSFVEDEVDRAPERPADRARITRTS